MSLGANITPLSPKPTPSEATLCPPGEAPACKPNRLRNLLSPKVEGHDGRNDDVAVVAGDINVARLAVSRLTRAASARAVARGGFLTIHGPEHPARAGVTH